MGTLAQHWMQQGIEKGREEGVSVRKQQVALNMLKEKVDKKLIAKITGLSLDKLNLLKV